MSDAPPPHDDRSAAGPRRPPVVAVTADGAGGPADPRGYLAGRWRVTRALRDRTERGRLDGVAEFAPDAARTGLVWDESGEIAFGAMNGHAQRRLLVVPADDGWEVRFSDGRPFHPLDLASTPSEVRHNCGRDLYVGSFDVLGVDAFDVAWTVTGPAKDQAILSRYRRIRGG